MVWHRSFSSQRSIVSSLEWMNTQRAHDYMGAHDYIGTNAQIDRIIVALDGANAGQEK